MDIGVIKAWAYKFSLSNIWIEGEEWFAKHVPVEISEHKTCQFDPILVSDAVANALTSRSLIAA